MPRRSQRRRTNKRRVSRGGAGTATWAPYGGANEQHAGSEGNLIATNAPSLRGGAHTPLSPALVGGKQQKQQQGAGVLNDIALPAMLIYANNLYGRRRSVRASSSRRGRSFRRRSASRRRR